MYAKSRHLAFMTYLLLMVLWILANNVFADEVYLKNNDKISGKIIEENENSVSVKTKAMGVISVRREFIENIIKPEGITKKDKEEEPKESEVAWQGEFSAGYNTSTGNTKDSKLSLSAFLNRNRRHIDEWTFKGNVFYSESNQTMDAQKWYAMGRYGFTFGASRRWYNFYSLEADHDKFANVYYRIIPASGLGYWFFDLTKTKLLVESALGLEYTDYYADDSSSNLVAVPRLFYEQEISERAKFTQDIYLYPALTDLGSYRTHSVSAFTFSIKDGLSLRLELIDDYNPEPSSGDIEKNDLTFMSSLIYAFGN